MYISKHLQAHLHLEKSGVEVRETKKVRYLLESIDASSLNAATETVRATDRYLESFDLTTTYMRTFIIANYQTEHRNVESLSGTKQLQFDGKTRFNSKQPPTKRTYSKGGSSKVQQPTTGLNGFYKPEEWKALSYDKKSEIMALRKKMNVSVSSVATDWEERTKAQGVLQTATVSSKRPNNAALNQGRLKIHWIHPTSIK
jgi:hypothetical protein